MSYTSRLLEKEDIRLFMGYVLFAAFAYFIGMVTNYLLNKYLNFKNRSKQIVMQFGLFAIVALVGLGINQFLLYSLVEFAKFWYISAKIIAIIVGFLWSFYGHKKLTFNIFR